MTASPLKAVSTPCRTSARRDALCAAIAQHGGVIDWTVDHTGWVVTLYLPVEGMFSGGTLEDGLRSCLAWLVASEGSWLAHT